MSAIDVVIDVLHARYGPAAFGIDPATAPKVATVKGGNLGAADFWWASCLPCWWWDEDDDHPTTTDPTVAQARADEHNRRFHPTIPRSTTGGTTP